MAFPATQIRKGMVLVFEGEPVRVIDFRHHTPGNLRAMVQAKLKNLRTGSSFEHRFRAADSIERASMETHDLEFLYQAGDTYHFMNTENYDQLELDEEQCGAGARRAHAAQHALDVRPGGVDVQAAQAVVRSRLQHERVRGAAEHPAHAAQRAGRRLPAQPRGHDAHGEP